MTVGRIQINGFVIPELTNTEEALAFGSRLTADERRQLMGAYKAMELASLNATHLQDRADFATIAQRWHEAAESKQEIA